MAFMPTTVHTHAYLFICLTSTSQYKNAIISNTHPPDAKANELVLILFMIGVMFAASKQNPSNKPIIPAITRYNIFLLADNFEIKSLPANTPQMVCAAVGIMLI